ncbi:MAG: hypothetical protein H0X24_16110 [Ktedonobacterales bacterium]|nr:hypothetical protein [Ktedonobacterales bacterium]
MDNRASSFSQLRLAELRASGYRPAAWAHLLRASWGQARQTAHAHPHLVRDWRRLAAVLGVLPLGLAAASLRRTSTRTTLRRPWPLVVVTATQLGDIYVHLGMHHQEMGAIHPTLGPAMLLTTIRGWVGGWLLTRFVQHQLLSDEEMTFALAAILLTDLGDGPLAHHTARHPHRRWRSHAVWPGSAKVCRYTSAASSAMRSGWAD